MSRRPKGTQHEADAGRTRVGLVLDERSEFSRQVVHGVVDYNRAHADWELLLSPPTPAWDADLHGDGVVVFGSHLRQDVPVPIVRVGGGVEEATPQILPDHDAVGRLAAEHFIERGLRHFAYVGPDHYGPSNLRHEGFARTLAELGQTAPVILEMKDPTRVPRKELSRFDATLARLERPCGVLAFNDLRGVHVIHAARRAGLRVPDDLAVLGVDNDELLASLPVPPLSSIDLDAARIGFEAARMLHALLEGRALPGRLIHVPPGVLVARQSTDMTAVEDPAVAAASSFIRDRACTGIGVADVVAQAGVSRRALERRFAAVLGRTLAEEIRRVQVERAKDLLLHTDKPVVEVGRLCGIDNPTRMSRVFAQVVGVSPQGFRARRTGGGGDGGGSLPQNG